MSVILGYKSENKLYLAADNRTSTKDDVPIRDDVNKIVVVNDNVAVAFAGYGGTQAVFESMIKNASKNFRVEDALFYIKMIYWICKIPWYKRHTKNILILHILKMCKSPLFMPLLSLENDFSSFQVVY